MTHRQSFHGKNATMTPEVPDEIRVYLAGPDVFLREAGALAERKRKLCRRLWLRQHVAARQ